MVQRARFAALLALAVVGCISFAAPPLAAQLQIAGAVSYTGSLGPVTANRPLCLCVYLDANLNNSIGCLIFGKNGVSYNIDINSGTYYLIAFLDLDRNEQPTFNEPYQIYNGRAAAPADPVVASASTSGIDFTFGDENLPTTATPTSSPTPTATPVPPGGPCTTTAECGAFLCNAIEHVCCNQEQCPFQQTCRLVTSPGFCTGQEPPPTPLHTLGESCTQAMQCDTGFCTDHVCCLDRECTPPERCNVLGFEGVCGFLEVEPCRADAECESGHCNPVTLRCLPAGCAGDCDASGEVTIDEIITMVNVALGGADLEVCAAGDADGSASIEITDIIEAVNRAANGC